METKQRSAYYYGLAAIFFWSTIATAFSLALDQTSIWMLMFGASLIATLSLLVILSINRQLGAAFRITRRQVFHSAILGFINPFFYYYLLLNAYKLLPAQEALVLNYIWPISLVLLSIPLLRQKIGWKSILFISLSFLGVMIIATGGKLSDLALSSLKGDLYAIFSSVAWALYWIINMKDHREEASKLLLNFLFGTGYILVALWVSEPFVIPGWKGIAGIAWVGLFELGITFYFWLKALSLSPRTDSISGLVYLSPFISLMFISLILGEKIEWSTIAGLVFILSGIILNSRFGGIKATGND